MASVAFLRGPKVTDILASGRQTVMTAGAVICDCCVVKNSWRPGQGQVTGVTFGIGCNMSNALAGSSYAIMTAGTVA